MAFPLILPKEYSPDFSNPLNNPIEGVEVDYNNTISVGLQALIRSENAIQRDYVTKLFPSNGSGTRQNQVALRGRVRNYSPGSDFYTTTPALDSVAAYTFFVFAIPRNYSGWNFSGLFTKTQNIGTSNSFGTFKNGGSGSGGNIFVAHAGVNVLDTTWSAVDVQGEHKFFIRYDGSDVEAIRDGITEATAATGTAPSTGAGLIKVFSNRDTSDSEGQHYITMVWDRALSDVEVKSINENPYQLLKPQTPPLYFVPSAAAATAVATGTLVPTSTETQIVSGGRTAILTLTGDTFVTGTTSEDGIAAGSDSDIAASGTNWDSLIKTTLDNTDVVLSVGNTVATITLPAFGTYDIPGTETITWTIPAASLTTSASPIIATPTFTVTAVAVGALRLINGGLINTGRINTGLVQ